MFQITAQDSLVRCNCFTNNSIGIWQSKANCRQRLKSWFQVSRANHTRFPDTHSQQNVNLKKPEKCDETIVLAMLGLLWTSCCSLWLNWSDHTCFLNGNEMTMMFFSRPSPSQKLRSLTTAHTWVKTTLR